MSGSRKAKYLAPCNSELNAAHHVFQKHFESHFEPLPQAQEEGLTTQNRANAAQSSDSSEDEWSGISGDEQDTVEVVDHASKATPPTQAMGKRELKAFMSSRPPSDYLESGPRPSKTSTSKPSLPSQSLPEDSRTLLAQDLALHRLITESHLLNPSSKLHTKPFSQGRIRMHATDLRITSLAPTGTKSILAQDKMPMTMRKGIKAAKKGREDKRRKEAWENGIVLERKGGLPQSTNRKRKRPASVDLPSVGRLRGAELRLSESDLRSMGGDARTKGSPGLRRSTVQRRG